jgi:hypothetical protein
VLTRRLRYDAVTATFNRARRRRVYGRLARVLARKDRPRTLLPLDEAERRLRPFNRAYVGLRAIPVAQVIGTDGRGSDFDRDFLPRRPGIGERWRRVEEAFPEADFPPIVVFKLGDAYFVVDGHHRVALARQRGMETIDAEVTELRARWHLPADADLVQLVHAEQERIFAEESGLARSLPEIRIRPSRPGGYTELLENVQIHGYHLMLAAGKALETGEIAADWFREVYTPAVEAIRADGLLERFPDATEADLFLHLYQRRRQLFPDCGCPPLAQTASDVASEAAGTRPVRRLLRLAGRA